MGGLDNIKSGQLCLDGWVITYNLFRDHEGIGGRPPGEKTNVDAPFESWEDVVHQTGPDLVIPQKVPERKVNSKGKLLSKLRLR